MKEELSNVDFLDIINIVRLQYGYDFTGYAQASIKRRLLRFMGHMRLTSVFELKHRLVNDQDFFARLVQYITVNVTEMFRDPLFYKTLREQVLPKLAAYPNIKIWHAGCSTGEEVFSMAILLHEAGLLSRTKIYATDLNPSNLDKAMTGILALDNMKDFTQNYIQSGGLADFSNYYTARYDNVLIKKELRQQIVFFQHNLVTDKVFNEFQLICCRNVFIYFNRDLQNTVLQLFYDSLSPRGYLGMGIKETMRFADIHTRFEVVHAQHKIYRRKE
ncbi:CheR family methyltransferase [Chitinophaga rhizophila]|uniref:Protein-glutamate O-methyltransferase CheR n=1 Tax=Chitinophaga rhizophila TaxID=2866212 RepID=A0ABS7GAJ3_9BACT|nr:protein-glutamate O-methyltransferase CheR [Chitinophaga rhizophila]MBW8683747.1 protein-glutamate O-methyltransferase CheR [Chitinophaga rhizophila]